MPREPGIDRMLGGETLDQVDSLFRDIVDAPSTLGSRRLHSVHSGECQATVAPAGTAPERSLLEQNNP